MKEDSQRRDQPTELEAQIELKGALFYLIHLNWSIGIIIGYFNAKHLFPSVSIGGSQSVTITGGQYRHRLISDKIPMICSFVDGPFTYSSSGVLYLFIYLAVLVTESLEGIPDYSTNNTEQYLHSASP